MSGACGVVQARGPALAERGVTRLWRGRRAAEAPLPAARPLLEAMHEAAALLDASGRILHANAALARLAGAAIPLAPGSPAERLVAPAARAAFRAGFAAALEEAGGAAALQVAPADPAAPADAAWTLRLAVLRAPEGDRVLLTVADDTARRRAGHRAAEAARLETVGRLAGGIAHDFNNLLTAVIGAAAAARDAGVSEAAAAELAQVEEAARRGAALVAQLLAFARQQRMEPQVIDLRAAIGATLPLLRRLVGSGIAVELVPGGEGPMVRVDPAQLDQVLLNLAANAREAMPAGGQLRIALGRAVVLRREEGPDALPPGRFAVLEVADTGAGIAPEVLPRLFEPFFTTRPERGGTGLGLATVQGIVAQLGGHIAVESRQGAGTTFRIHLPRHDGRAAPPALRAARTAPGAEASDRAAAAPAGVAAAAAGPPPPAGRTEAGTAGAILLVEDEATLRRLAQKILEREGHRVVAADCAEAALDLLTDAAAPPRALVTDVAMPGEDGLSLARRLRSRWPDLPVLLLSGYAEAMLDEPAEAAGMAFLAKPFAPADLAAAVSVLPRTGVPAG